MIRYRQPSTKETTPEFVCVSAVVPCATCWPIRFAGIISRFPARIFRRDWLLLLLIAALPSAFAAPVSYMMTGYVQGSGGGIGHGANVPFIWTVYADTSGITSTAPGQFQNPALSSVINFVGDENNVALTGVTVYLDANTGQLTFGSLTNGGIGFTSPQLTTWNLASLLGPLQGANVLIAGAITKSDGNTITLAGVANTGNGPSPTFQASSLSPTVSNVQNAAGNIAQGLPNAPIAQGSIFVIKGNALGPPNPSIAPEAFQTTTLSNASASVTVGGTSVNVPLYYTSWTQVAALLPSNVPTGTGTVTVTYNGQTSAPAPVTVVANNVGIFTLDYTGQGPGVVTFPDYTVVSAEKDASCGPPQTPCGSANPGDVLLLWATGLGPVNGSDISGAGLGQNMPNIPLTVWIGGVQAPVTYQGRSGCCIGEDQIVFTVPANAPTGCAVPLVVQIGSQISNNTVIPVANGSRNCTPTDPALASANLEQAVLAGPPLSVGFIGLVHYSGSGGSPGQDQAQFVFGEAVTLKPGIQPYFASWVDDQPVGSCLVYNNLNNVSFINSLVGLAGQVATFDAGSSFTIQGPGGNLNAAATSQTTISATGTYLVPGAYTVTGNGGANIGRLTATVDFPSLPTLVTPVNNATVTRSKGMTVNWTGGGGVVQIVVGACADSACDAGAQAYCTAPASAGTFTIPAWVLLALPASSSCGIVFSSASEEVPFTVPGLTVAYIQTYATVAGAGLGWGSGNFILQ